LLTTNPFLPPRHAHTEKRVLSRKTREAAINESVDICKENLKRILYAIEFYDISVPIGITVETGIMLPSPTTSSLRPTITISSWSLSCSLHGIGVSQRVTNDFSHHTQ
jgi:hypothetical protein